ncbi:hypothetical protein COW46_04600 [Candidatus Gracilibacteria bacterium CG17_big_fil_post_rev_8_21_14_2_50_48_13]|nr:MAG: hypothetical protein COW46_04600 [Candidatus Gracilibacteria bacterium CG17_big_fil_post_rev_8_21_14_2_50_48_13]
MYQRSSTIENPPATGTLEETNTTTTNILLAVALTAAYFSVWVHNAIEGPKRIKRREERKQAAQEYFARLHQEKEAKGE